MRGKIVFGMKEILEREKRYFWNERDFGKRKKICIESFGDEREHFLDCKERMTF